MEEMDTGFEDFAEAFDGADGNQTGAEETVETESAETGAAEEPADADSGADGAEKSEEDSNDGADKTGEESEQEPDSGNKEQKFEIRVNKETKEITFEEARELAQKGADYDRVKGQLETIRKSEQELRDKIAEQQPYIDFLIRMSEQSGVPVEQMIEQINVELLKEKGMTEAEAKAEIRASKAEQKLKELNAQREKEKTDQESVSDRAKREVEEFRKEFPDVELTEELCGKLMPDVQVGISLVNAYRKLEAAQKDAEIQELKRQLEAEKQNRRNREKSPGSQKDSGGQTAKSEFDEFAEAFR